jgi:AmmeMemoRadiSam system protein B/AmmeMemoRadiSam system protein A
MNMGDTARPPAVAGSFYTADAKRLASQVRVLLAEAEQGARPTGLAPKALIVPHAGLMYSGPVAASAYASLREAAGRLERVVLFGPSHRVPLRGLAAPGWLSFATPLGEVAIDQENVERAAALPMVAIDDRPHAPEHSLEVQLPFLQCVLGDFRLTPLVVGDASAEDVAAVMDLLWGGPETLLVVSSDLSHYYDYATARRLDAATSRAIEALDPASLGRESACGRVPVRGLLVAARARALRARSLDVRSSGDTAGPRDQVVGYGAYAFYEPADEVSDPADREALELAGRSIEHAVRTGRALSVDESTLSPQLREPGACFVTLHRRGALRGCVGELEPTRPLADSIVENARSAALYDTRFPPVQPAELADLELKLSMIGPLRRLRVGSRSELLRALRPGVDGVILEQGARRATLLPSVWQRVPDAQRFVSALEGKAGLSRRWSPERTVWTYDAREIPG